MEEPTPWWVVILAAITPAVAGAYKAIQWWLGRNDANRTTSENVVLKREENLAREVAGVIDNLRTDIARCRVELDETDQDRNRNANLARRWHARAWRIRHNAIHARQYAESLARLTNQPPPVWPDDLELPDFEDEKANSKM